MKKTAILKMLREADGFVSGQVLCEQLGVSRTAVWKYINQLKEEGYVFEAVSNKGYRIVEYPDILTDSEILSRADNGIIREVIFFPETDSTNNQAKKYATETDAANGTLFITECQTGGRGRRGRSWVSPAGSGIWMSLLLRPQIAPEHASMLTIVAAMAMAEAIKANVSEAECGIKWPNDIVMNGKKICGILTEMSAEMDYVHYVVIGIGLNVNTTQFDESIKDVASSIYNETGKKISRSAIVAAFSRTFAKYYDVFMASRDLSGLTDEYNRMLVNKDREVRVLGTGEVTEGVALGIKSDGELMVKKDDGTVAMVRAGEVSVRGLYGYV
ncbi:MAG: biotin--[acetyl-CoA-carboxylase] ligase [Lachnospira sp.]